MIMLIFGIMLVIWCSLIGWYLNGKGNNWMPTIITSFMTVVFMYAFFEMYRQGAGRIKLLLAGIIGVVIVFMEYGILDYALNRLKVKEPIHEDEYELEEVNKDVLSNEIREKTALQFGLDENIFNLDTEKTTSEEPRKYNNIISRCQNFEKKGNFKLALRLYEDCIKNANDYQVLFEAEEGATRCKEELAG
ncbi:MAG: hypothetical protein ACK5LL_05330 [Suipraeoptans sp.]